MSNSVARQEARTIEKLAKDTLHEARGQHDAEDKLLAEVAKLEQDPALMKAVKSQIARDNFKPWNTLPSVLISDNAQGKVSSILIENATFDLNPPFLREKLDVDTKTATKMPRTNMYFLDPGIMDERADKIHLK